MDNEQKELLLKEKEEYNYECFDSMMTSLFDLASELHDKLEENKELTSAEVEFLLSFDLYVDSACELSDSEEELKNVQ